MNTKDVSQIAKNLGGAISKNSPTILTGLAVGGLLTTVILAVRVTPKALSIIDDEVYSRYEEGGQKGTFADFLGVDEGFDWSDKMNILTKREILKLTWKLYLPSAAIGAATIACIIGANHISLRRNAALASLYGITEAAFKEYKAKVVETIGKNKELKVRDEISADRIKNNPSGEKEVFFTGKGEVLCYDSMSGRYFKGDIEQIRRIINKFNRELLSEMFKSLNDLYYELGLSNIKLGDEMGWDVDKGMLDISFSSHLNDDGEPCLVLNYDVVPRYI